jgi:ABC-type nickel/cobalt efflux system permease component RcnA
MKSCGSTSLRSIGIVTFALGLTAAIFAPRNSGAHPMGNFSISHYAGIRVDSGWIEIRYILDMAEIPTFQEMQQAGIVAQPGDPGVAAYLARKAEVLKSGLALTLDGRPLALETVSENVIFPPGAGGLPTMKVGMLYRGLPPEGATSGKVCTLIYRDGNYPERAGWKEVVATAAPGLTLHSNAAATISRSNELSNYPTDLVNSPPQDLSAQLTFTLPAAAAASSASAGPGAALSEASAPRTQASMRPGTEPMRTTRDVPVVAPATIPFDQSQATTFRTERVKTNDSPVSETHPAKRKPAIPTRDVAMSASPAPAQSQPVALEANKRGTPSNRFTQLINSNQWGLWFLLTAALIAAALGGLHALEPGHGKTIVAAYLVGSRGTAVHALLLGLIVTATHTAGVYALGAITLYASKYIVPDHLYPWLGIASGLTIAVLGAYMLRRRYAGHEHGHHHHHFSGHGHVHDHQHHHHEGHSHGHAHQGHVHVHADEQGHGHHHHEYLHDGPFSYRQLALLGVTGGIIPCPAALVVLLSAVSLHRVAFGLYLILAFSVGLAAVLISIGLITVYARRLLARVPSDGPVINRWLPMASAAFVTCLGLAITVQSLSATGVLRVKL